MGALTIAFDIIIVGALALPWVYLLVNLFFFEGDNNLRGWLKQQTWTSTQGLAAALGVVLFAMAFTLGSAISRIAQDFFNDDDLGIPHIFRMTMTEDRIIASVYCEADENLVLQPAVASPSLAIDLNAFHSQKSNCCEKDEHQRNAAGESDAQKNEALKNEMQKNEMQKNDGLKPAVAGVEKKQFPLARRSQSCVVPGKDASTSAGNPAQVPPCPCQYITSSTRRFDYEKNYHDDEDNLKKTARDIFGIEENFLLLKGEDATQRLRQLHDQIMVLRGATFDGLVALAFCLFGWGARAQREKRSLAECALLTLVPAVLIVLAGIAFYHHTLERQAGDPPYMEFSLFVLGCSGAWLLWLRPLLVKDGKEHHWLRWPWATLSLVFAVLFAAGVLGWWATEKLYAEQVVYSYNSQVNAPPK